MEKSCSFPECDRRVRALGLCEGHYKQHRLGQELAPLRKYQKNVGLLCNGPGCDRPATAKGLCDSHKSQKLRKAPLTVLGEGRPGPKPKYVGVTCSFEECDNPASSRGLCRSHYMQWQRGTELRPLGYKPPPPAPVPCSVPNCEKDAIKRGLCENHYRQAVRQQQIETGKRTAVNIRHDRPICSIENCPNPVVARTLCRKHYSRVYRKGNTNDERKNARQPCTECGRLSVAHGLCDLHYRRTRSKTPTLHEGRICVACGNPVPAEKRLGAEFCSDHCKRTIGQRRRVRRSVLKLQYGITEAEFTALIDAQNGRCAICDTDKPGGRGAWCIDHDHLTGKRRALLCTSCNVALGHFKDRPEVLDIAAEYLRTHSKADEEP